MRKENNFEDSRPTQIVELERQLKRIGYRAHTGNLGKTYEDGETVETGELKVLWDRLPRPWLRIVHTHKLTNLEKDGVWVKPEFPVIPDDDGDIH